MQVSFYKRNFFMKRILSLLLTVGILLTLCACSIEIPNINIPLFDNDITAPNEPQTPVIETNVPNEPDIPTTNENTPPPTDESNLPDEPEQDSDLETTEQDTEQQSETPPDVTEDDEEYIRTIDPYAPMVALTFDDGPHELYSQQILDVLEQYHAVATFFEVGYNARLYPDILR
ncbi:MAG: polysaccharide deacetylase family protein, partial [Oscillospiraceae bacterium]|nr:polysaccharide deacetylase family protein [Oscillospiraceae bacterium]